MEIRAYYKNRLAHLETPEFVRWFESWHGDESVYPDGGSDLLERYWSERRFALFGWQAALMPCNVSGDRLAFLRKLEIKQVLEAK